MCTSLKHSTLNCIISKLAAERDSKKLLASAEEERRNLGEYLHDSEVENEKMSKKRKSRKHRRENNENVAVRSKRWRQSVDNKENISGWSDDSKAEKGEKQEIKKKKKECASTLRDSPNYHQLSWSV